MKLLAILLIIPLTSAAPMFDDPTGDVQIWPTLPATGPLADAVDIVQVRSDLQGEFLEIALEVLNLDETYSQLDATSDLMFIVDFDANGTYDVRADLITVNGQWTYLLRPNGEWSFAVEITGEADLVDSTVRFFVPLELLNATAATFTAATVQLHTSAGLDYNDFASGEGVVEIVPATNGTQSPQDDAEPVATPSPLLILPLLIAAILGRAAQRR